MKMIAKIGKSVMVLGVLCVGIFGTQNVKAQLNFGDHKSSTLTGKAWGALGEQKYDDALGYIAKCIELYGAEAKKMQASLQDYPATDPKEEAFKFWALNDVGTCIFIKGEVLMKKGDKKGALEAYKELAKDYKFAQCWDNKGWFWKPAEAAKKKVVELEFDNE